jgi:hypothetical protein
MAKKTERKSFKVRKNTDIDIENQGTIHDFSFDQCFPINKCVICHLVMDRSTSCVISAVYHDREPVFSDFD